MHGFINQTTRTASTEEDGVDHIGFETPRSGVATPQPDPQDKRLPGIMSYFGQVRSSPSATNPHSPTSQRSESDTPLQDKQAGCQSTWTSDLQSSVHSESSAHHGSSTPDSPLPKHENLSLRPHTEEQQENRDPHPYPTPPISQSSSCAGSTSLEPISEDTHGRVAAPKCPPPISSYTKRSTASLFTTTHFQSTHDSPAPGTDDSTSCPLTCKTLSKIPETTLSSKPQSTTESSCPEPAPSKWYSFGGLKELTRVVSFKSGPPTPTRALSTARPSRSLLHGRPSHDGAEKSGTQTPRTSGAQAPAARGKLTIKIIEGRGLRKSRDPYVVVVFQRSELISGGPHPSEDDDNLSIATPGVGGIPIQRQGSDSGRPMAIPMRSRQSSNTSVSEYNTFRNRNARLSFANPKWDAAAELYVPIPPLFV